MDGKRAKTFFAEKGLQILRLSGDFKKALVKINGQDVWITITGGRTAVAQAITDAKTNTPTAAS